MCAAGLQNNLRALPGIRRAEVSSQEKQAIIDYDSKAVAIANLEKVIADAGFKVTHAAP